jgi:hypothetical protein
LDRTTPAADGDEPSTLTRPGHAEAPFRYVQSDFELHFPGGQVRACLGAPFDIDHPGDTAAAPARIGAKQSKQYQTRA